MLICHSRNTKSNIDNYELPQQNHVSVVVVHHKLIITHQFFDSFSFQALKEKLNF